MGARISQEKIIWGVSFLGLFVIACLVWYSPVLFKGYASYDLSPQIILGRNLSQTGFYAMENDFNVMLAPESISEEGRPAAIGNRLTAFLYSKIFELTGISEASSLLLLSVFIHALTLLLWTGLTFYLFNFRTSLVFGLLYLLMPFYWSLPFHVGAYEFALFFLALSFVLYFYGISQKNKSSRSGRHWLSLIVAGFFLALACMARESFFLIAPFFLLYLWLSRQKAEGFYLFASFGIIISFLWLPHLSGNAYLQHFTTQAPEEIKSADYTFYGHLFPDPYTYHFEKEAYLGELQEKISNEEFDFISRVDKTRLMQNLGLASISFFDRIKAGFVLLFRHLARFFSFDELGGSFTTLFLILGAFVLKRENKLLFRLFFFWLGGVVFTLSFVILAGRSYLADIGWPVVLLASLGLLALAGVLADNFFGLKRKGLVTAIVLLLIVYNLILANHLSWSRHYDQASALKIEAFSQKINQLEVPSSSVIAANLRNNEMMKLNYLTDRSLVYFSPKTMEKILAEGRLNEIFKEFKVDFILGYSEQLSGKMTEQAAVRLIASSSYKPEEKTFSRNKSWLLNLIK